LTDTPTESMLKELYPGAAAALQLPSQAQAAITHADSH
jgi:hypothetical protein